MAITTKPGDTLEAIAARNNVSLLALEASNMHVVPGTSIPAGSIVDVPVPPGSAFSGLRRLLQAGACRSVGGPSGLPPTQERVFVENNAPRKNM